MVERLIKETKNELSGFYLKNIDELVKNYHKAIDQNKKVVIFGVSYALLDLAEKNIDLSKATIIETGGMKGRRKELSKEQLHNQLKKGLNCESIASEYGMTELFSQSYSNRDGLFELPNWMQIILRDTNDPFSYVKNGKTGGINVVDLAKRVYVVEGPLDCLYLDNGIAMMDAALYNVVPMLGDHDYVFVFDNEPRNAEIVRHMKKAIDMQKNICIWPKNISEKDINDMILSGMTGSEIQGIIDRNTHCGLKAKLEFENWRKV
jgi:hypothetical protein